MAGMEPTISLYREHNTKPLEIIANVCILKSLNKNIFCRVPHNIRNDREVSNGVQPFSPLFCKRQLPSSGQEGFFSQKTWHHPKWRPCLMRHVCRFEFALWIISNWKKNIVDYQIISTCNKKGSSIPILVPVSVEIILIFLWTKNRYRWR